MMCLMPMKVPCGEVIVTAWLFIPTRYGWFECIFDISGHVERCQG